MSEPAAELTGVIVPLLTPTDREDRVDEDALRRSIDRLVAAGVHGLFVGGTAGEGPLLTETEWDRLVAISFEANRGRLPLLGGAQDSSAGRVVSKIRRLRVVGYRYFVVTPTYYISTTTDAEHLRLFAACHEAADGMEFIPYNIPQVTGSKIAVETFREGARQGWFRCCKESSGDPEYLERLIREGEEFGLKVFAGVEQTASAALAQGAAGFVPVCANVEPETYTGLWDASRRRDQGELKRFQARIDLLVETLIRTGPCWLSGPKYALSRFVGGQGAPVSPLLAAHDDQIRKIDEFLSQSAR